MSKEWIRQRRSDQYYRKAKAEGYRSRAAYKLKEMDNRLHLLREGSNVIDVGASPGGWTQVVRERVGDKGRIVAVDLVPMPSLEGVVFIQGDVADPQTRERVLSVADRFDVVLSDASSHLSGNKTYDRGRGLALCWAIMEFAVSVLKADGTALLKVFQGDELLELRDAFSPYFKRVDTLKPKSSLDRSSEVYLAFRFRKGHGAGIQHSVQTEDPSGSSEPQ